MTSNPQVKPTQEQIEWAREWYQVRPDERGSNLDNSALALAQALAEREAELKQKLDEAVRKARLEEAEWWADKYARDWLDDFWPHGKERLATLRALEPIESATDEGELDT